MRGMSKKIQKGLHIQWCLLSRAIPRSVETCCSIQGCLSRDFRFLRTSELQFNRCKQPWDVTLGSKVLLGYSAVPHLFPWTLNPELVNPKMLESKTQPSILEHERGNQTVHPSTHNPFKLRSLRPGLKVMCHSAPQITLASQGFRMILGLRAAQTCPSKFDSYLPASERPHNLHHITIE